jgi:hypothetical protein
MLMRGRGKLILIVHRLAEGCTRINVVYGHQCSELARLACLSKEMGRWLMSNAKMRKHCG